MLKRIKLMRYALGVGMLLTLAATSGAAYASWHPRDNSGAGTSLVSDLNLGGDLSLLTGTPAAGGYGSGSGRAYGSGGYGSGASGYRPGAGDESSGGRLRGTGGSAWNGRGQRRLPEQH